MSNRNSLVITTSAVRNLLREFRHWIHPRMYLRNTRVHGKPKLKLKGAIFLHKTHCLCAQTDSVPVSEQRSAALSDIVKFKDRRALAASRVGSDPSPSAPASST